MPFPRHRPAPPVGRFDAGRARVRPRIPRHRLMMSGAALASALALVVASGSALAQGLRISEVMSDNASAHADDAGDFSDWVELHNASGEAVSLEGFRLGDDDDFETAWLLPGATLEAGEHLVVYCVGAGGTASSAWHADFAVSARGEAVTLFGPDGAAVDRAPAWAIPTDHSLGRPATAPDAWAYFADPTPGEANVGEALAGPLAPPRLVAAPRSDLAEAFELRLSVAEPGVTIRYTLDGADVTAESPAYDRPLTIAESTVVRARSFRAGALASATVTNSYLFADSLALPIVSLAIDPEDFYGDGGIYTRSRSGREAGMHVEYFERDGGRGFGMAMGAKMHAPDRFKQRSMRLYARDRYGADAVEYPLFDALPEERFRRLVLRNGGNDGTEKRRIHVKDGFAHRLYDEIRPRHATAAYAPVNVFLNGEYFGIFNLRERQDEHYLRTHYDVDCEAVDFLEYDYAERGGKKTICGDWDAWESLKAYILASDLSEPTAYARVAEQIDLDDFIDYQAFGIYIGNVDWLNNNIKFWRERRPGGKWRWLLWDTEYGMGTVDNEAGEPDFDFMTMALDWGGWGNGDHTWMLRGLMANARFRERFLQRYMDLLNTTLRPGHVVPALDSAAAAIAPDLPRQLARWGSTATNYATHLAHTRDYLTRRRDLARRNAALALGLDTVTHALTVDVSDVAAGGVRVNSVLLYDGLPWLRAAAAYPWRGDYPRGLPLDLTALPAPGYRFSHWEGSGGRDAGDPGDTTANLRLTDTADYALVAVFEATDPAGAPRLLLNEVVADNERSHTDGEGRATDWVEVYNPGHTPVDLGGAYLTDDPEEPAKWQIPATDPAATTVGPGGYLVLYADGDPERGARHLDFKLSKGGEYVGLSWRSESGEGQQLIDEVTFPALDTDEAYARLPDGGSAWVRTVGTTPGASNATTSAVANAPSPTRLRLSPNPATDYVELEFDRAANAASSVTVTDLLGRVRHLSLSQTGQLDVQVLPKGVYTVRVDTGVGAVATALLVVQR